MNILIVTPAQRHARSGNRITALRWAGILRSLGHRVRLRQSFADEDPDLLIALHARRSHASIVRFHERNSGRPIVVALTGTDLYGDLPDCPEARRSLELATRLVVLQQAALQSLDEDARAKARIIHQSVPRPRIVDPPRDDVFEVCVLGHLRPVKDPFRIVEAARRLPERSRVVVTHAGAALDREMGAVARAESKSNPRYAWLGDLPRGRALRILGRSRLSVSSSIMEGGANALAESIAASVPVLSTRVPGSVGMLGEDYAGYFPVGDTDALAALLIRAETDGRFYELLRERCARRYDLFTPALERHRWASLAQELS